VIGPGPSVMYLADFVNGNAFKPSDFNGFGDPVVRIAQLLDESAELDLAPAPSRPVWIEDGDLVFSWSATLSVRFWRRGRALLNQHLFRVDVHPGVDRAWFAYVLEEGTRRLEPLMHGSAMRHITQDMLKSLTVGVPPLDRQRLIADHLDSETGRIDAVISARRQQAALLQEGIDSQLLKLVDPSEDGVQLLSIRRILQKQSRAAPSLSVVTAFRDGMVGLRDRRREDGFTESITRSDYQGVRRGDVVFHGLDGFAGAIGVSEDDGICTPAYHVCEAQPGFDSGYVALALRGLALSGYLALQSGNVRERAVDFRNWNTLAQIQIPVPSLEQQRMRARAYMVRRRWTDRLVEGLRRQVALLHERRQALVAAAMHGQLDLPEVS
jgi:type I restriction enzyme S subunit